MSQLEINCGKCFKDTSITYKKFGEIAEKNGNLKCKCGNFLIKDGLMSLR